MIAGVMPVRAPHGKVFYIAVAVLASPFGFLFVWAASGKAILDGVPPNTPMVWRAVQAGVAALFLIGAMQAFERWLAPARAQARSAAISNVTRARLLFLRSWLLGLGVAASMLSIFRGGPISDISVLVGVFFFAGYSVADLCGERR
jgi:hypothetical protein